MREELKNKIMDLGIILDGGDPDYFAKKRNDYVMELGRLTRKDIDLQESILFNLQMAIQNCTDIAATLSVRRVLVCPAAQTRCFTC